MHRPSRPVLSLFLYVSMAGLAPAAFAGEGNRSYQPGFEVEDPLFEELFGDRPGPKRFLTYGTKWGVGRTGEYAQRTRRFYQATAKRFGARFVVDEVLDEAAQYNLVVYGNMSDPQFAKRGIATESRAVEPAGQDSLISLPDGSLPYVYETQGWLLDPRYLDHLASEIGQRAREADYWGIPQFDEIYTYYAIKPVPRDQWYEQVFEADRQIRQEYGFGKFGMPETHEGGTPFERIAHRRWVSDRLTECFAKAHKAAKAVNPGMKLIGPTHGGNVTSADMEAWSPYFDIMGGQASGGQANALLDWVRPGANTKLYVDLTGKPIWMMVHTSMHKAQQRHPEAVREFVSQVFRNGGQGLWLMNSEFFERELEDSQFSEPAKWRALLELSTVISRMKLPRLPEPDCAILYASDSTNTTLYGGLSYHNHQDMNAYAAVGPALRSWPQFVSDRQIDRDDRDLADYKVLYVPYAPYQRASVLAKIETYVRGGGTVICTDTEAFTWNINGEKFGAAWEKLTGVRRTGSRETPALMSTVTPNPVPLEAPLELTAVVPGSRFERVSDRVVDIAVFDDGSPAVTLHRYGKGKVIFFAADPFYTITEGRTRHTVVALGSPIVKLIEAIQKMAGVAMGHDIWRFKLPPYQTDIYQRQTDTCLTGNYVYDANDPLLEPNNIQAGGTYTYSRAPTTVADEGTAGEPIPLAVGHLTNRLKAYQTRNKRQARPRDPDELDKITAQWIVGWDDPAPIGITFEFGQLHPLTKIRMFYSGTMPALQVHGSEDGQTWKDIASTSEATAGEDVKDVAVDLAGKCRYVRLEFATRTSGSRFELCEVEIWGEGRD